MSWRFTDTPTYKYFQNLVEASNHSDITKLKNLLFGRFFNLVHREGFEPPTPCSEDRCSIQLSYRCIEAIISDKRVIATPIRQLCLKVANGGNSGILQNSMTLQQNIPLVDYSTMRLGGRARYFMSIKSEEELLEALNFAKKMQVPFYVLGGGSNTIFQQSDFTGLIIKNDILGIAEESKNGSLEIIIGAGEKWDDAVALSVTRGFCDIAALSLIPGSCGAAPVQNIGAYGQQVSDSLVSLRAYDTKKAIFVELARNECNFSYRRSRFNTTDKKRFIITSITLKLQQKYSKLPFYADISTYFASHGISENAVTPMQLREATSVVRVRKLPDPSTVANSGSFFKNPIVSPDKYNALLHTYPSLKAHKTDDGFLKLYGAQLIELSGLKDFHDKATGMATWKNQALVIVNEQAKTTDDLMQFKQKVIASVKEHFDITLIQEPEIV